MSGGPGRLAARLHARLLGTGVGERTESVLRGLAWVAPAALLSRVLAGLATLLAARWLGPGEWGHASLALAASLWIQVPLFLGLPTAIMHFLPRAASAEREAWARTALLLLAVTGGITLGAGVLFRGALASLHGMGIPEFAAGLLWCGGFLVFSGATAILSGREAFGRRALAEVLFALAFPAAVLALRVAGALSWQGYVASLAGGYAVAGIAGLLLGGGAAAGRSPGGAGRARALLSFGGVAAGGALAGALLQAVGRQVTFRFFEAGDVGILAAYQAGSVQMALYFLSFATQVFFPVASRTPDRGELGRKVGRLLLPVTAGASLFYAAALLAWMLLLGREYPLRAAPCAAFALAAGLATSYGLLSWFLASGGPRGVAAASLTGLVAGAANALLCVALIPRFGLTGAGAALATGYALGILSGALPGIRRWGVA